MEFLFCFWIYNECTQYTAGNGSADGGALSLITDRCVPQHPGVSIQHTVGIKLDDLKSDELCFNSFSTKQVLKMNRK